MAKENKDYVEILNLMRSHGRKDNPTTLELGTMTSSTTCTIGELPLDKEDLLIAEHLTTGYFYNIDYYNPSRKDSDTFIEPLKNGDVVALLKLENQDRYVILCKVVDA